MNPIYICAALILKIWANVFGVDFAAFKHIDCFIAAGET